MSDPLEIFCFSDVLCVYAYAADIRFEELEADFGDEVRVSKHFISVYGDVRRRLERSGKSSAEYGEVVHGVAKRFEHVEVHPDVFKESYPPSSLPSHLYLRAVKLLEDAGDIVAPDGGSTFDRLLWSLRVAFFRDLADVSKRETLDAIADAHGVPTDEVRRVIDDGRAFAELDHDARLQREHDVRVSPTLVLNEGRQHLNGNVGYRVIEANVRELLRQPRGEMSWC